jgi:hypothetical protein
MNGFSFGRTDMKKKMRRRELTLTLTMKKREYVRARVRAPALLEVKMSRRAKYWNWLFTGFWVVHEHFGLRIVKINYLQNGTHGIGLGRESVRCSVRCCKAVTINYLGRS